LEAFQHEKPDVHKAVLKLLEKHAKSLGKQHVQVMREKSAVVAASLRKRLIALLPSEVGESSESQEPESQSTEKELLDRAAKLGKKWAGLSGVDQAVAAVKGKVRDLSAIHFDPMDVPHLDPDRVVKPITDLDELIDVFLHVLEEPGDPMNVERVLDGVSRLCDQRPADFTVRTGPLAKRARPRNLFEGSHIVNDLCGVAIAWTQGLIPQCHSTPDPLHEGQKYICYNLGDPQRYYFEIRNPPTVMTFLAQRLRVLAERAAVGQAVLLLSAPTHGGGWIDPRVLAHRTVKLGNGAIDVYDQALALLRLAPEHRSEALKIVSKVEGEWSDAFRYALGASPPRKIGPSAPLWIAAARARSPRSDDPLVETSHPGLGPDAGRVAHYAPSIKKWRDPAAKFYVLNISIEPKSLKPPTHELVTVVINGGESGSGYYRDDFTRGEAAALRWMATVWPARMEPYFAKGATTLSCNLDWWEAEWGNKTLLEPLLDPDAPLEQMGLLLLALGLAAKDPGEHGLATDAMIAAIDDGRVDGELLGGVLADLLPSGLVKAARFAKTLGQAARPSPLHAYTISTAIARSLRGDPSKAPRDLSALLELFRELLAERQEPLRDAETRKYLQGLKAGGKTGKLVRELLSNESSKPIPVNKGIAIRSLESRLERAERWQRWAQTEQQKDRPAKIRKRP
jgi:hypothetical protein